MNNDVTNFLSAAEQQKAREKIAALRGQKKSAPVLQALVIPKNDPFLGNINRHGLLDLERLHQQNHHIDMLHHHIETEFLAIVKVLSKVEEDEAGRRFTTTTSRRCSSDMTMTIYYASSSEAKKFSPDYIVKEHAVLRINLEVYAAGNIVTTISDYSQLENHVWAKTAKTHSPNTGEDLRLLIADFIIRVAPHRVADILTAIDAPAPRQITKPHQPLSSRHQQEGKRFKLQAKRKPSS